MTRFVSLVSAPWFLICVDIILRADEMQSVITKQFAGKKKQFPDKNRNVCLIIHRWKSRAQLSVMKILHSEMNLAFVN